MVSNAIFVGEKHPLFAKYADRKPVFPMLDREQDFINNMYFINEKQPEKRKVYTATEMMVVILDRYNRDRRRTSPVARPKATQVSDRKEDGGAPARQILQRPPIAKVDGPQPTDALAANGHANEIERLKRIVQKEVGVVGFDPSFDVDALRRTLSYMYSSKSWKMTSPIRKFGNLIRGRGLTDTDEAARIGSIYNGQVLKNELDALQASTSWRITAPLRYALQFAGRR